MPPTPTESLTNSIDSWRLLANPAHSSGCLTNSAYSQRRFHQCFPLLLKVWPISPSHEDTFDQSCPLCRKFDESHPFPEKFGSILSTRTKKNKHLINAVHSNRMFDQSPSLLQTFLTNCVWWCIKSYQSCPLSQSFTSPSNSHRHSWTYLAIAKFEQSQPHP